MAALPLADLAIVLGLILAIFAVYSQVGTFDFVNYDDNEYVSENVHVQAGLTPDSIKWAMTAVVDANWMPVTMLSHMLDCQLFHLQSGTHHLVSMLLHMLAALLLFAALRRATGARWPSAFVAMVFAVHPLHVESVAWVAERKDVLSTCFWFLALYGYARYAERPTVRGYFLVALAFCLGLMAKPMLVTFPFTLLLLDFWPLRRFQAPGASWQRIVLEKIPLICLSAAASCVTYLVQDQSGARIKILLSKRIANALVSYLIYIGQMFWPTRLAVIYLYRQAPPIWQAAAAAAILLTVTAGAVFVWRTRPYVAVGWFWFLGTLVPVIGLVQVGLQSHADRYMYVPMTGLLLILAWGGADVVTKWPRAKWGLASAATVCCLTCLAVAHTQTEYWRNSETLFSHATQVTENNLIAEMNLGDYLMNTHRGLEAIPHFEAALRTDPQHGEAESNIGMVLGGLPGRMPEAISHFEAALRAEPDLPEAHYNLGLALSQIPGREAEAIAHFEASQHRKPRPDVPAMIERLRARSK